MSWKATYEFILSLETFRNIDLFDQGVYYLDFGIYFQDNLQNKQYATPYHFTQNNIGFKQQRMYDTNVFDESIILDNDQKFKSKVFSIKYCEEEVPMNDLCCFRAEVNADNNYKLTEFFLECDLYCALTTDPDRYKTEPMVNILQKQIESNINHMYLNKQKQKFEKLSAFKSVVRYSSEGLHEFLPIIFDKMHYCVLECSFHSLLLDFKFRNPEYLYSQNLIPIIPDKRERSKSFIDKIFQSKNNKNGDQADTDESDSQQTQDSLSSNSDKQKQKDKLLKGAKYRNVQHFIQEKESVQSFYQFYVVHLKTQFSKLKRIIDEVQDYSDPSNEDIIQMPHPSLIQIKDVDVNSLEYYNQLRENKNFDNFSSSNHFSTLSTKFGNNYLQAQPINNKELYGVTQKKKREHLNENEQNIFVNDVQREINQISGSLFQIWSQFIDLLVQKHSKLCQKYVLEYNKTISERWGEAIFRQKFTTYDLFTSLEDYTSTNNQIAKQFRKKFYFNNLEPLTIENIDMFPDALDHPIFFQEIYQKRESSLVFDELIIDHPQQQNPLKMGNHLIILCHGFQGSSYDLRLVKNNIVKQYPTAYCLCSRMNEDHTDKDLEFLGKNLALEIRAYIAKRYIQCLSKISFIGHSMGGVIARAALPHLSDYSSIMYSYISICSPHLGCYANSNKLIDAGLWIMQKIHKSQSLLQLSMRDASNIEDTYLYQLSNKPGLNWFQNVMFISSYDDQYVPTQSARVLTIPNGSKYHNQMVENISRNFKSETIYRLDVNFKLDSSIDRMIGRAAHIHFLECETFSQMLSQCYPEFFQ